MRASIAAWNVRSRPIERKIEQIVGLGFQTVAFMGTLPPPATPCSAERLSALLRAHGLDVLVHGVIGDAESKGGLRQAAEHIDAVARFQGETGLVRAMTFDPGFFRDGENVVHYAPDHTYRVLEIALSRLGPLGVCVGLENWAANADLDCFRDLAARLSDPSLGVLLDLGHLHIACHSGRVDHTPAEYIARLPLPVWELHVHDNDGSSDQHQPLGRGTLNVESVAQALHRRGFDGYVTVEILFVNPRRPACRRAVMDTRDRFLAALQAARAGATGATLQAREVSNERDGVEVPGLRHDNSRDEEG